MSTDIVIIPAAVVDRMRRKAKELKKHTGISHHEALDQVARADKYFRDWHHLIEHAKATELTEQALNAGFIIGMDRKDADFNHDRLKRFVRDERVASFIRSKFKEQHPKPWSDDEEFDWEEIEELIYFRSNSIVPDTLEAALEICDEDFYFPPRYVRLRGKVIDLYSVEDDGNV